MRIAVFLTLALPFLVSCSSLGYYAQSIHGQLDLLGRRQPIEQLITDPETSDELRYRLSLVLEIRDFASQKLGLPENGSYRSYADLGRPAMVWSTVATPEFSMQPKQWCYPVIGCAAYRGYFSKDAADEFATGLSNQGFDVVVEPVPAYSTLGWFDDPLPSTVLHWSEPQLAGLIFHELAHQKLYYPDDSNFNEAFATAVEHIGTRQWITTRGDLEQLGKWQEMEVREGAFIQLLLETRQRLIALYAGALSETEMRLEKAAQFEQLRDEYEQLKQTWGGYNGYNRWFDRDLNNARLASVATYRRLLPGLLALYEHEGSDIDAFYRVCDTLATLSPDERTQRIEGLMLPAVAEPDAAASQ